MQLLEKYTWPGNIRELENVLERAVILATDAVLRIDPEFLGPLSSAASNPSSSTEIDESLATIEREHLRAVLERTGWVIEGPAGAAKILGLHPNTLRSRLKRMGIQRAAHEGS